MNSAPLVEARQMGRRVEGGETWLLRGISWQIQAGQRWAVTGPSGAGKSLLLRSLALLDPLHEGDVSWHGERVHGHQTPRYRSKVMYLHQRPALFEGTVRENLHMPLQLHIHEGRDFDEEGVITNLRSLGRDESFLNKNQRELSGGEGQLVALLRAILLEPELLLLDEPTAALDADAARAVERLAQDWLAQLSTRAYVWVSHDAEQTKRMADHQLVLAHGRMAEG